MGCFLTEGYPADSCAPLRGSQALGQLEWRQGNAARAREVFELGLSLGGRGAGMQVSLLSALAELELGMKNVKRARCGVLHMVLCKSGMRMILCFAATAATVMV